MAKKPISGKKLAEKFLKDVAAGASLDSLAEQVEAVAMCGSGQTIAVFMGNILEKLDASQEEVAYNAFLRFSRKRSRMAMKIANTLQSMSVRHSFEPIEKKRLLYFRLLFLSMDYFAYDGDFGMLPWVVEYVMWLKTTKGRVSKADMLVIKRAYEANEKKAEPLMFKNQTVIPTLVYNWDILNARLLGDARATCASMSVVIRALRHVHEAFLEDYRRSSIRRTGLRRAAVIAWPDLRNHPSVLMSLGNDDEGKIRVIARYANMAIVDKSNVRFLLQRKEERIDYTVVSLTEDVESIIACAMI